MFVRKYINISNGKSIIIYTHVGGGRPCPIRHVSALRSGNWQQRVDRARASLLTPAIRSPPPTALPPSLPWRWHVRTIWPYRENPICFLLLSFSPHHPIPRPKLNKISIFLNIFRHGLTRDLFTAMYYNIYIQISTRAPRTETVTYRNKHTHTMCTLYEDHECASHNASVGRRSSRHLYTRSSIPSIDNI